MTEQCFGMTARGKECRNRAVPGDGRFCGRCKGSAEHMRDTAYAEVSAHRLPAEDQMRLVNSTQIDLRLALAKGDNTPPSLFDDLADDPSAEVRSCLIRYQFARLSDKALTKLAHDPSNDVRRQLAQHDDLPLMVQTALLNDKDSRVRSALASFAGLSPKMQRQLAQDPETTVRVSLAGRSLLAEDVSDMLLSDADSRVRCTRVRCRKRPFDTSETEALMKHADVHTRLALVAREDLSSEAKWHLAYDKHPQVVGALIFHHFFIIRANRFHSHRQPGDPKLRDAAITHLCSLPMSKKRDDEIGILAQHSKPAWRGTMSDPLSKQNLADLCNSSLSPERTDVWELILRHKEISMSSLRQLIERRHLKDENLRHIIERHSGSGRLLRHIADHYADHHEVMRCLAQHRSAPADLLARLARSPSINVRAAVASNCDTPLSAVKHLAKSSSEIVLRRLAYNPQAPGECLRKLTAFLDSDDSYWWWHISSHPMTPKEILEQLSSHADYVIRANVAAHETTPECLLVMLAMDCERKVAEAAANSLQRIRKQVP